MSSTKYRSESSEDPVGGEEEEVPVVPVVAASIIKNLEGCFDTKEIFSKDPHHLFDLLAHA
jgi:hypothetical protein